LAVQPHFPDGTLKTAGAWHSVDPEEGVRQGGPYSCVLAALSLVKLMQSARAAADIANGIEPLPENSQPAERLAHWKQASATSDIMAYLDDCTLNSRMHAVVMASAGYMGEGVKRNWQFVAYKSILSGAWYGPPLQTELWDETIEREDGQPPAQANSPFSVSTRPMCAEILP